MYPVINETGNDDLSIAEYLKRIKWRIKWRTRLTLFRVFVLVYHPTILNLGLWGVCSTHTLNVISSIFQLLKPDQ